MSQGPSLHEQGLHDDVGLLSYSVASGVEQFHLSGNLNFNYAATTGRVHSIRLAVYAEWWCRNIP